MKIDYVHASRSGHGVPVAEEFRKGMTARGVAVTVRHIREADPTRLPGADLYVFSSPGRLGKPIRGMRRFLTRVTLPAGTKYALLTTEAAPLPEKKKDQLPATSEVD